MNSIFGRLSGWSRLSERFPVFGEPQGRKFTQQTVKVGPVRWKNCTTLVAVPSGVYLQVVTGPALFFGRLPPVLIPWAELRKPRSGRLYLGLPAVEMSVGTPEIIPLTLPLELYRSIQALGSACLGRPWPE